MTLPMAGGTDYLSKSISTQNSMILATDLPSGHTEVLPDLGGHREEGPTWSSYCLLVPLKDGLKMTQESWLEDLFQEIEGVSCKVDISWILGIRC